MASGHVNRTKRPNTWLLRPALQRDQSLDNPEPPHMACPFAAAHQVVSYWGEIVPPPADRRMLRSRLVVDEIECRQCSAWAHCKYHPDDQSGEPFLLSAKRICR